MTSQISQHLLNSINNIEYLQTEDNKSTKVKLIIVWKNQHQQIIKVDQASIEEVKCVCEKIPLRLIHFEVSENVNSLQIVFGFGSTTYITNIEKSSFVPEQSDSYYHVYGVDSDGGDWTLQLPTDLINQYVYPNQYIIKTPVVVESEDIKTIGQKRKRGRPRKSNDILYPPKKQATEETPSNRCGAVKCDECNTVFSQPLPSVTTSYQCYLNPSHTKFSAICPYCSSFCDVSQISTHIKNCKIRKLSSSNGSDSIVVFIPKCEKSKRLIDYLCLCSQISKRFSNSLMFLDCLNEHYQFDENVYVMKMRAISWSKVAHFIFVFMSFEQNDQNNNQLSSVLYSFAEFKKTPAIHYLSHTTTDLPPYSWPDFLSSLLKPNENMSLVVF